MSDPNLWITIDDEVVHPDAPRGGSGQGHCKSPLPLGCNLDFDLDVPHPFSPVGRNTSPDETQTQQLLDAGTPRTPDARTTDELPVFTSTSGVPITINADTVVDFVNKVNAEMGGGGVIGHMIPDVKTDNVELDSKGMVSRVNMVVNTKIVRPRLGGCRSEPERVVIKQAEEMIKAHEERHRDICRDFMIRACKAMLGAPGTMAMKICDKFIADMDKAQAAFDAKEGQLYVDHANGSARPATGVHYGPVQNP